MTDDRDDDRRDEAKGDQEGSPEVRNPFASDEPTRGERGDEMDAESGDQTDGTTDEISATTDGTDATTGPPGRRSRDAPLSDLAERVGERGRDRDARDDSTPFEEVEVGDIDTGALWESLATGEPAEPGDDDDLGQYDPSEAAAERVEASAAGDTRLEHVLDKREYCQRCPHLSAPPDVACGHDDTDIVEVVDGEHFRVRGCPMATAQGRPNFAAGDDA
ncbi:hypothetical protein ACFQFH_10840 [Halobaculum halobium]|uniref:DUF8135 domain-containing protein n=1 Tax=Halobaculum halobium TaxID=3032281 RepID=A0ABD5TAS2_9EURY|nr:hypothetical protein [Halobaculum sp. SYNS20]